MWIKFIKLLGFRYVMNKRTKEVHNLDNIQHNCGFTYMSEKNKKYITKRRFLALHKDSKVDGCRWCMKEYNHEQGLSTSVS